MNIGQWPNANEKGVIKPTKKKKLQEGQSYVPTISRPPSVSCLLFCQYVCRRSLPRAVSCGWALLLPSCPPSLPPLSCCVSTTLYRTVLSPVPVFTSAMDCSPETSHPGIKYRRCYPGDTPGWPAADLR